MSRAAQGTHKTNGNEHRTTLINEVTAPMHESGHPENKSTNTLMPEVNRAEFELQAMRCLAAVPELLQATALRPVHFSDDNLREAFTVALEIKREGLEVAPYLIAQRMALPKIATDLTDASVYEKGEKILAEATKAILACFNNDPRGRLLSRLTARRFDPRTEPPQKRVVFEAMGVPVCTEGNLTVISALPGAGKSAYIASFMAAAMASAESADTLGIYGPNKSGGLLLHIDTEQDPNDSWHLAKRAMRRAEVTSRPDWLHSYSLADFKREDRRAALLTLLEANCERPIFAVLIDGGADLIASVNDEEEAIAFVEQLHQLAIRFRAPVIVVLHINKGQNAKTRGHLGSELSRKCETEFLLTQKDDVTTVTQTKVRRKPITPYGFKWSDEHEMHVLCDPPRDPELIKLAREVFDGDPEVGQNEWIRRAVEMHRVGSDGTARNRWKQLKASGIVSKTNGGKYAIAV